MTCVQRPLFSGLCLSSWWCSESSGKSLLDICQKLDCGKRTFPYLEATFKIWWSRPTEGIKLEVEDRCGDNNDYTAGFAKETNHLRFKNLIGRKKSSWRGVEQKKKKKKNHWAGVSSKAPVTQSIHCPFGLDCSSVKWVLSFSVQSGNPSRKKTSEDIGCIYRISG